MPKGASQSNPEGGTSVGHHICPSNDVEPFSILHILQCSSKKGLFKIGLHPHGFKFFYRFFGSLWIWPTLWVFKGESQSNPEGAAPWATQSNHTVSNEVEPFLKTTDFTNDLLKIGLSKKNGCTIRDSAPHPVPLALNDFGPPFGYP